MVRTKVFVGNLSFKTTDKDLAKEFEVAGKVATANIISRGSRSLGYGFVEMESEEEAKKSVELLNRKTIDGREINVEVARPREDRTPASAGDGTPAPATGDATTSGASPARRARRGGNRRAAGGAAATGSSAPAGTPAATGDAAPASTTAPKRTRAPRKKPAATGEAKTEVGTAAAASGEGSSPAGAGGRRPRAPRAPRDDSVRTPSTTTLFVANLPFTVDDAALAQIFNGLNIKSAHVVRKLNNTNKSKGFGFVDFHNQEDQIKALEAINKKVINDRELSVKVALAEAAPRAEAAADASTPAAGLPAVPAPGVAATAESK